VEDSSVPGISYKPLSTLIPATIPLSFNNFTKFVPSLLAWKQVSVNMMTPEMCLSRSGVVNNNSLYFLLFSSVFSTLIPLNLFSIVPVDSSAASIPLPGVHIF